MRYFLLVILTVIVLFKNGDIKEYYDCFIPTLAGTTDWKIVCHEDPDRFFYITPREKISIFDIEKITETPRD